MTGSYKFNRWSNSSLTTLQMCAEKFRLRYLERDRRPSGLAAKRGIAVHKIASEVHKKQLADAGKWDGIAPRMSESVGTKASITEACDLAATEFEVAFKDGVTFSKDDIAVGIQVAKATAKDAAIDLSALYVGEIAPPVTPIAVEREITIKPKDSDITILGKLDLAQSDDGTVIRDLKTAEKTPFERAADVSQQLTVYNMIWLSAYGALPRASRLVHLVRTPKRHELSYVVQETTRDMADVDMLVKRIVTAVDAVKKGVFVPADPGAPGSPCNWCEYNDGTCKYVRQRT